MSELRITFADRTYAFEPGRDVGIGRSPHNAVIVTDPSVSRDHARVTWTGGGWVLDDLGKGRTFIGGMAVASVPLNTPVEVRLASPLGPAIRLDVATGNTGQEAVGEQAAPPAALPADAGPGEWGTGIPPVPDVANSGSDAAAEAALPGGRAPGTAASRTAALMTAAGEAAAGAVNAGAGLWDPGTSAPARAHARPDSPGGDFATAVHILLPIKSWLKDPGWKQGSRLLVIAYGLLPSLFVVLFSTTTDAAAPGWAYSLAIAPLWALAFWLLIRPGRISKLVTSLAGAIVAAVVILMPVMTLPWERALGHTVGLRDVLPWIYGVGLAEETTKALPILVAALTLRWVWKITLDVRVWMFLGTIAGLAFGVRESVLYTSSYLTQGNSHAGMAIPLILTFALRVFVDGFQHAVWAGIAAFFVGIGVNYRRRRIPLILFGIALPAVLHGLNDWSVQLASHWLWIVMQAISLLLFIGYTMSAATIERQVRDTPLFRGESMVMSRAALPGWPDDAPARR